MIRSLKLLVLMALSTCFGCAWADRGLQVGPAPVVGIGVGAATNGTLLLAKAPWWARLGTVAGIAYAGRFTPMIGGHKNAEFHIEVVGGAMLSEWVSWMICRGPCERRR